MAWNTLNLSTIYLADGTTVEAEVNGISLKDGSGYALLPGLREIKVKPLEGPWSGHYAEEIIIKRNDGTAIKIALTPFQRIEQSTIITIREQDIYILRDNGIWREMTDDEREAYRIAWQAMKRLRVRVRMPVSAEDIVHLRALGCDERPYMSREAFALFGASSDHEHELRALDYVESVEIMPTLTVAKSGWLKQCYTTLSS